VVQLVDKEKVAALITAESIIVGFFVTFGSGIGPALVSSIPQGKSIFGAVLAGLLISGLVVTAFESIYLLYRSIDISCVEDVLRSDERYRAGYDLFRLVLLGAGFYVGANAFSILNYGMTTEYFAVYARVPLQVQRICYLVGAYLIAGWSLLVVIAPVGLTEDLHKVYDVIVRDRKNREVGHHG
jgi:hypothetical protein